MRQYIVAVPLSMVVATVACWVPDKPYVPPGPFDCHNVVPTTASDPVTINGVVQIALSGQGLAGAVVELFRSGYQVQRITTPAADPLHHIDAGSFSFQLATVGRPTEVYLRITDNDGGYLPILYYPAESVTQNITINPQMLDMTIAQYVGMGMNVTFDFMNKVQFLIGVVDCQENQLGGAKVTVSPPGPDPVHYFIDDKGPKPDKDASETDSATGVAVAANLLPQVVTVGATVVSPTDGSILTMLQHQIDAGGDSGMLIQTEIRP
jgi:hypothetical protein